MSVHNIGGAFVLLFVGMILVMIVAALEKIFSLSCSERYIFVLFAMPDRSFLGLFTFYKENQNNSVVIRKNIYFTGNRRLR